VADSLIQCLLFNWELGDDDTHRQAQRILDAQRKRRATVVIFLLASRTSASTVPEDATQKANDLIYAVGYDSFRRRGL
jgi:hypothetical protein